MMDPIKPKHRLTKKPNFKKQKLEGGFVLRSPGVYTTYHDEVFIPVRDEEPNRNGRIYNISVGDLYDVDITDFIRRLRDSNYGELEHPGPRLTVQAPIVTNSLTNGFTLGVEPPNPRRIGRISTIEEFQTLFGNPVGVSSRGVVRENGVFDLQSYDIVSSPPVPNAVLGGEHMMYNATTTMILRSPKKKKSFLGKVKDYFVGIYKKWKRVEE